MKINTTKKIISALLMTLLLNALVACSTPEEKAQSYYKKGMALLDENPNKAKLEFQNALQIKKNMTVAMYGLALVAERQADWQRTYALLTQVLEQDPKFLPAMVKKGQLLLAANQTDKALELSNKALELNKNDPTVLNLHAAVMLKTGDKAAALDYTNQALKLDPNNADSFTLLATERMGAADYPKAIEYLDQGLAKNPKNLVMYFIKINAFDKLNQLDNAQKVYEKVLAEFPENTAIRKNYAQFFLNHGNKVEAEKQIRKITIDSPKEIQPKLDVVGFVIATKGKEAGKKQLETYVKDNPSDYQLKFELVGMYQALHEDTAADTLLNSIVKDAGDNENGVKAKGLIAYKLIKNNNKEEASKLITQILNVDKRNEQALLLKAGLSVDAKDYEGAINDLRTILRDSPNSERALMMLATAHEAAGSPELAEEQYIKAFQTSKFDPQVGITYAAFLNRRNQTSRADKVYEDILKTHSDNNEALMAVAQAKMQKGDLAGAQSLAEQVKKLGGRDAVADQILGQVFAEKKNMQSSIAAFKRAYEAAPDNALLIASIVRTYMQFGKAAEAQAFIASVLKANPNNRDAQLMQAQLSTMVGDHDKSIAEFEQFVKINPKVAVGYQQLAMAYSRADQLDKALATLKSGLAVEPKNVALRMTLASTYDELKRYEDAIKMYEELYAEYPEQEVLINNLSSLLADHRTDKPSLTRAYELAQTFKKSVVPQYLDTFGWASYKVGKYDDAAKALEQAIEKAPNTAIFQYHLGKIYLAQNDKPKAKEAFKKAEAGAKSQNLAEINEVTQLLKDL